LLTLRQAALYNAFGDRTEGIEEAGYLMRSMEMPAAGWTIHALTSLEPIGMQMRRAALLTVVVLAALISAARRTRHASARSSTAPGPAW
jgi:hypothetical protein